MTTITFRRDESQVVLIDFRVVLRRALELSAAHYVNGAKPTM